jgi:hypothetical protein
MAERRNEGGEDRSRLPSSAAGPCLRKAAGNAAAYLVVRSGFRGPAITSGDGGCEDSAGRRNTRKRDG